MEKESNTAKDKIISSMISVMRKKPFMKVNVQDIVNEAGISRQSFYRYFCDKYDALSYMYKRDVDSICANYGENDISGSAVAIISYIKNYSFIYKYVGCDFGNPNPFMLFWFEYSKKRFIRIIGLNCITHEINTSIDFYLHAAYFIHFEYISGRLNGTPEKIAKITFKNIPDNLKTYLR